MSFPRRPETPSRSLPSIRTLATTPPDRIVAALQNLQAIYCPFRLPATLSPRVHWCGNNDSSSANDSGYVTGDEADAVGATNNKDDDDVKDASTHLATLRADEFERNYVQQWLTALISRVETFDFDDETSASIIDEAAFVLASFSDSTSSETDLTLTRDFIFPISPMQDRESSRQVCVRLDDAPLSSSDHTDVGLQSWGAAIILSELLCADPAHFGLTNLSSNSHVVELGAGTGLVSLTLAGLLPKIGFPAIKIVATDYHSAVLENLRRNIDLNTDSACLVETALLDWSQPSLTGALAQTSDMLMAADVVYAPEHAVWLRDCAARMLSNGGIFWLIVTVRTEGKFQGIVDTVEAAFTKEQRPRNKTGKVLRIIERQFLEKKTGIGRGDERGYLLHRIGWTDAE